MSVEKATQGETLQDLLVGAVGDHNVLTISGMYNLQWIHPETWKNVHMELTARMIWEKTT